MLPVVWACTVAPVSAQRVVPVHAEPRHRLVYDSDQLKVLDVQIQPSDTTLLHVHSTPITYVTVGTSSTDSRSIDGDWSGTQPRNPPPGRLGAIRSVLSYAERPVTHQVTNVGSTLFRLIAIPSLRSGAEGVAMGSLPGEILAENRWFRHATLTIGRLGRSGSAIAQAPTVLVLIRDGRVAVEHGDGWTTSLERAGAIVVVPAGASYGLRNSADAEAEVAIVEVR